MLKMLQRLIGENIRLAWSPEIDLWPVKMDPSQVDQILANLCINARDAIVGSGRINIKTGKTTFDEKECARKTGLVPGEYVLLSVRDDGRGMDKETLPHIFELFFTTKRFGEGSGLGLATIYGIIKQNNGYIEVDSVPGEGTTFEIYLPRHSEKTTAGAEREPLNSANHGGETILLVEDEPSVLKMTTRLLQLQGYKVFAARTPGEALHLASEHTGEIHLRITDVVMPEMNGLDLAGKILSSFPHIKNLFMSGYTADVIAPQGILESGAYFIQTPFSMKDLAAKVREALDGK